MPHALIVMRAAAAIATLAAAVFGVAPPVQAADASDATVSVAVRASGTVHEGEHVSYAIEVRNGTDRAMPEAVVTQQLPPNLAYVGAKPPARREGRQLTWTLAVPAHGLVRITMTGSARPHHPRPMAVQNATTVCVREEADAGYRACAIGRSALRGDRVSRWQRAAQTGGFVAAAAGAWLFGVRLWRRRAGQADPT